MKIVVLWSSPNIDGLTAAAMNSIVSGAQSAGVEVETIHLNRKKIGHCLACGDGWGTCRGQGVCALKDDFGEIYDRLIAADGIVFVSAVYWSGMTECMKAFVDRLRRCEAAGRHALSEKRCLLAACAGGTGRGTLECLHDMELALTHMNMRAYDRLPVVRFNRDYMLPALEAAGKRYVDALENGFNMYY